MEATRSDPHDGILVTGDLVVDLPAHQAWAGSRPIHLSHLQFVVLTMLVRRPGEVVTTDELADAAAAVGPTTSRTITGVIRRLRISVGKGPLRPRIEVVRSRGYRLEGPSPT